MLYEVITDKVDPDLVDIIVALQMLTGGKGEVLDEETIMRTVSAELGIPFKKLEPLDLDMDIVTKTIPRNFAIHQLILPVGMQDGVLEVAVYHPDCVITSYSIHYTKLYDHSAGTTTTVLPMVGW